MVYHKKLIGKKCYLSPFSIEDAEKWTEWFNDLEVTLPLGDEAYTPVSLDRQRERIADDIKSSRHMFNIVEAETDTLIGRCLLFNINGVDRHATAGIVIGEKAYWSKGYGTDAMKLLLDYGFNLLNLHSIMLGTFAFNTRAIACYKKVGFKEIGRRREARIIGNRKYDSVLMDILADEYESVYVTKLLSE